MLIIIPTYKDLPTAIPEGSSSNSIGHQSKKSFLYLRRTRYIHNFTFNRVSSLMLEINTHSGMM